MIARDHDHEAVAAERIGREPPRVYGAGDDADVGDAFGNQPDDLVRQALLQIDADIRMRGEERGERLGQEFGERIGVRQHAHLTGLPARVGAEVLAQTLRLRENRARVLQQGAAGLRRGHAAAPAHQKRGAERLFHLANPRARSGKREMRAFRAARDAARLHHMAKQAQIGYIETHVISPYAKVVSAK